MKSDLAGLFISFCYFFVYPEKEICFSQCLRMMLILFSNNLFYYMEESVLLETKPLVDSRGSPILFS